MPDDEEFVQPPPAAERYFNIARGDDPTWDNMPNGPDAVTAFALLSIAKSLIDLVELLTPPKKIGRYDYPGDDDA